jgi:periplasmic copper chaperone A
MRFKFFSISFLGAALGMLATPGLHAQVKIENAWVRATVPQQQATGAFMKITATEAVTLVAVTTPLALTNELHEMKLVDNVMKMRAHLNGIVIPAQTTLELKSSGHHIMMMELEATIKAGTLVPLTLEFKDAKGQKKIIVINAKAAFKNPYLK